MFNVYIDNLFEHLEQLNLGLTINNVYCGALGYADDIVLLTCDRSTLQRMLSACQQLATTIRLNA